MEAYRRLIGDNIRKQRELLHLTQEELAHQIGKDPSYIGRVERGSVNATIDNILRIARGLQVEPALLFQSDQPDRLRDYIPDVELSTLDPTQRHMSLVILKVLNMVVNQAEPDDAYAVLLRDRMLRTVPFTTYAMTSSHRLMDGTGCRSTASGPPSIGLTAPSVSGISPSSPPTAWSWKT